jgi:hypothetical protein
MVVKEALLLLTFLDSLSCADNDCKLRCSNPGATKAEILATSAAKTIER